AKIAAMDDEIAKVTAAAAKSARIPNYQATAAVYPPMFDPGKRGPAFAIGAGVFALVLLISWAMRSPRRTPVPIPVGR
ncbi:MAG: hypothetical protein B6D36_05900, partial [Planctomycetes bacterium UTPLA1]